MEPLTNQKISETDIHLSQSCYQIILFFLWFGLRKKWDQVNLFFQKMSKSERCVAWYETRLLLCSSIYYHNKEADERFQVFAMTDKLFTRCSWLLCVHQMLALWAQKDIENVMKKFNASSLWWIIILAAVLQTSRSSVVLKNSWTGFKGLEWNKWVTHF